MSFVTRTARRALLPALLWAASTAATPVTVNVRTTTGAPASDTLVFFDPVDKSLPAAHAKAVIDQVDKRFVPHVSVVRTGTAVTFPNSDNIRHQVYSFSDPKKFTLKLYAGSPKMDVVFDRPGLVVLGCNIHDSMVGFVGVVDTPYFGKISDASPLHLDLPEGRYRVRVWNPALISVSAAPMMEVGPAPSELNLTVTLDPARDTVAAWPE